MKVDTQNREPEPECDDTDKTHDGRAGRDDRHPMQAKVVAGVSAVRIETTTIQDITSEPTSVAANKR